MNEVYINGKFLTQQTTGVQMFAIEIVKELIKLEPNLKILAPKVDSIPVWAEQNIIFIGNKKGVLWEQFDPPQFLHRKGNPLLINLCNAAPIRYSNQIITLHDVAFIDHPEWFSKKFVWWYKFMIKKIISSPKKVITVSNFSRQRIEEVYPITKGNIKVIPNGSPTDLSSIHSDIKQKYILTTGSLDPRKNLKTIIKAFTNAQLTGWKLKIAGVENASFNSIEKTNHPDIEWLGYVERSELLNLYSKASIYVSASLYEGFGIPVLEAMHAGCKIILSDISTYKELYPKNVYYFAPEDPNHLVELLKEVSELEISFVDYSDTISKYSYSNSAKLYLHEINNITL